MKLVERILKHCQNAYDSTDNLFVNAKLPYYTPGLCGKMKVI